MPNNWAEKWGDFFVTTVAEAAWKQHGEKIKGVDARDDAVGEAMDFYGLEVILGDKFADFTADAAAALAVDHPETK